MMLALQAVQSEWTCAQLSKRTSYFGSHLLQKVPKTKRKVKIRLSHVLINTLLLRPSPCIHRTLVRRYFLLEVSELLVELW